MLYMINLNLVLTNVDKKGMCRVRPGNPDSDGLC